MKFRDWLDNWGLKQIKLSVGFAQLEWAPQDEDRLAAWDLYVELLTRVATQPLLEHDGDEASALTSVHSLFSTTRSILRARGPRAQRFAQLAIVVLNQIVRPFTAKWHREQMAGAFQDETLRSAFRNDLVRLQAHLTNYTRALADLAGVEDLTGIQPE